MRRRRERELVCLECWVLFLALIQVEDGIGVWFSLEYECLMMMQWSFVGDVISVARVMG